MAKNIEEDIKQMAILIQNTKNITKDVETGNLDQIIKKVKELNKNVKAGTIKIGFQAHLSKYIVLVTEKGGPSLAKHAEIIKA